MGDPYKCIIPHYVTEEDLVLKSQYFRLPRGLGHVIIRHSSSTSKPPTTATISPLPKHGTGGLSYARTESLPPVQTHAAIHDTSTP